MDIQDNAFDLGQARIHAASDLINAFFDDQAHR